MIYEMKNAQNDYDDDDGCDEYCCMLVCTVRYILSALLCTTYSVLYRLLQCAVNRTVTILGYTYTVDFEAIDICALRVLYPEYAW